ncbi:hypothetical protein ROHU_028702 [Labeo rohita]|uniref:Uncharacterized protein n=1 Tax=Labeo rohita TaxID=84645 RepID=A0A498M3J1_LABRO|nr:hypothetical protein ROHU_028702 [Labeo rohita]
MRCQFAGWPYGFLDFLTGVGAQSVPDKTDSVPDALVHRLGSPQVALLSTDSLPAFLTRVCGSSQANGRVVKHADDTVLLALLSSSEYDDSQALLEFSACRDGAGLQGNISKTKEMAI